jgi:uncharacterized protein HemX
MNITWATLLVNFLIALLSAGGVGWIITAKEDKKQKQLENKAKEQEIEEHQKDEVIKDWKDIAEERRKRCEELKSECDKKDEKIIEKDNTISELRSKLDARNTYCAVSEMLRCEKVACTDRKPPYGMKEIKLDDNFENLD